MPEKFYKTTVDMQMKLRPRTNSRYKKAIAEYLPIITNKDTSTLHKGMWQPDLLYVSSILVSEGRNDNGDGFLRPKLIQIYDSPENKFVDYEHDPEGENKKGHNPDKYQIVGHIYESVISLQRDGKVVPANAIFEDGDGKWFPVGSEWRDTPIDLTVAWVLYKFQFPELADLIELRSQEDPEKFGVSMEVLFSDYKYRVGDFDPAEDFHYDATKDGMIEAGKDTELGAILGDLWRERKTYNGKQITRILGGTMFFSGMAITLNRANRRSINLTIASQVEEEISKMTEESDLNTLIKQVASRSNFDVQKCELVDGEPSCNCLEVAISSQIEALSCDIKELAEAITKRKDVNPKEGEHKYGGVKYADEKNKKYPIDTEKHIRAAHSYFSQHKNSSKYSSEDQKTIREKINSAWKKHIDKDGPPSEAKSDMEVQYDAGPNRGELEEDGLSSADMDQNQLDQIISDSGESIVHSIDIKNQADQFKAQMSSLDPENPNHTELLDMIGELHSWLNETCGNLTKHLK